MTVEASLRRRIVGACLILALVLCSVYAVLAWLGIGAMEDRLLDDRLVAAADDFIRIQADGGRFVVKGDPTVYRDDSIPSGLRQLGPGLHELRMQDRVLHALVLKRGGHDFVLVQDESDFERLEGLLWSVLGGAFALCIALALLLGMVTARRVIRPLVALADAVRQHRFDKSLPALSRRDEVGVLARALLDNQQQMQRYLAREQLFTGDVTHELRTPLTIMLGAAEVLAGRLTNREDLAVVERIRRTAAETGERVGALLMLSRAPQELEFPRVALASLLEQEVERCRDLLQGKPVAINFQVHAPADAFGRPELMSVVFGNLLRNACHFTDQGIITVSLNADHVDVEDTGRGIPPGVQGQIFERHVRADDRPPSAGLGLAIAQRVCEHLGWRIELTRSDAAGTSFVVWFSALQ